MQSREHFGGRAAVILTMAGSAIGLGNIWRFPYLVGQNGGAIFILLYILFAIVLAIPIFMAESAIGRSCSCNCREAVGRLVPNRAGRGFGMLLVFTPLFLASYYSVVGGWSLEYLWQALQLKFTRAGGDSVHFGSFISNPWGPLVCHLLFLGTSLVVVAFGVKGGIERLSKICMPLLFIFILAFAVFAVSLPGASAGVSYLLKPDPSKLTMHTVLDAMGQAFFSLSLGSGIIITYSSYISKKENLMFTAVGTSLSDLIFACMAATAIIPVVFAAGIEPGSGPGLVFETLPYIFSTLGQTMPITAAISAIIFFLSIFVAALTSSIALLEVGVSYLTETKGIKRGWACCWIFLGCGLIGALCSLSFGPLKDVDILGLGIFDFADTFCSNVLLVAGALLGVILAGWVMPRKVLFRELTNRGTIKTNVKLFPAVRFLIRYVAPLGIILLIVGSILL